MVSDNQCHNTGADLESRDVAWTGVKKAGKPGHIKLKKVTIDIDQSVIQDCVTATQ